MKSDAAVYASNSYLVLGDWNRLEDSNTLIDAGGNGFIMSEIERISTGFGKRPLEQIILTHSHSDHTIGLSAIKERFNPAVYAFTRFKGVDELVADGQIMRFGDRNFEVVHTPGHSNDSICLYCASEQTLFSGDTPLNVRTTGGSYERPFVDALERLAKLDIECIYSGHDLPVLGRAKEMISNTLSNVKKSTIK